MWHVTYTVRVKTILLYLHATAIMLARAVLFPYFLLYLQTTISRPGCLKVMRCANVNLYLHYNTIVQCRSGYVVSLATPTKAEPLYKVHTHAGPCSQFYDRGCPHLEVILEYFCLFLFFLLYRVSLSEVHCKQEQQRRQHRYQFFVFFIRSRRSL